MNEASIILMIELLKVQLGMKKAALYEIQRKDLFENHWSRIYKAEINYLEKEIQAKEKLFKLIENKINLAEANSRL